MALAPGDTNKSFIREVDENLRRSQAEDFFKRWGLWVIGAILLLLVVAGGLLYWRSQQAELAAEQSQKFYAALNDLGTGNRKAAEQKLAEIEKQGPDQYVGLSQMTRGAVALEGGNRQAAIAAFGQVAADNNQPQPLRDAALVRQTALQFDTLKPEDVIARLEPMARAGHPWFGAAGEMTAMAMLKQNRNAEAGRMFAAIAADKAVPGSLRSRAVQIAGTLGVDATAQMPNAEQ